LDSYNCFSIRHFGRLKGGSKDCSRDHSIDFWSLFGSKDKEFFLKKGGRRKSVVKLYGSMKYDEQFSFYIFLFLQLHVDSF
jgi:hypothetical protein